MAKVRIGFSTQFTQLSLKDEKVGIGTSISDTALHLTGDLIAQGFEGSGGVSSITTYDGFIDSELFLKKQTIQSTEAGSLSGEIIVDGEVTVSTGTTLTSGVDNLTVTDDFTLPGVNVDEPTVGTTRFNNELGTLEFYTGNEWRAVNSFADNGNRGRGLFAVGYGRNPGTYYSKTIEYITIATQGNAQDFGELLAANSGGIDGAGGCASETRGLFWGGNGPSAIGEKIEMVTIASKGNGIEFGDMGTDRFRGAALSNSTRGLLGGGRNPGAVNIIDYVNIAQCSSALDFGDLMKPAKSPAAVASSTRGVFAGGHGGEGYITSLTLGSKGTWESGRDLFYGAYHQHGGSTGVRGMWAGGYGSPIASPYAINTHTRSIRGVMIASDGNAIEFGELQRSLGLAYLTGLSNRTRACWGGGYVISPNLMVNTIEYFQMNSSGVANHFGDLSHRTAINSSCSDSHGGLGGF